MCSHPRRAFASLAALLMACSASDHPASPTAPVDSLSAGAIYVKAMMDVMQAHSINRRTINWSSFRTQVLAGIPAGANVGATFPAIRVALTLLGDNHSFYTSAGGSNISGSSLSCSASTVTGVPAMGADLGYVRVTAFSGTAAQALAFTDSIQSAIKAADGGRVRGWIVDLRGNTGGNMWPMIAGIGPILGTGTAGHFIDPDGAVMSWGYTGTASQLDGAVMQVASAPHTVSSSAPKVAVLIDQRVGSAGEAVAVAFKQRANTRFFGTATCGASTANMDYRLSDGALLHLTQSVMADRTKQMYGGPLQPDEMITDVSEVVSRAGAWLLAGTGNSAWLYNQASATSDRPGDPGYSVGYRMAGAYYPRATNKAQALKDIIEVANATTYLNASGYNP